MADDPNTSAAAPGAPAPAVEQAPAAAAPEVASPPAAAPEGPSYKDVMNYDPFKGLDHWTDDPAPAVAPGAGPSGAGAPAAPSPPSSGAGSPPTPQTPAPAPAVDPVKFAALLESNSRMERELGELRRGQQPPAAAAPAAPAAPADDGLAAQYQANIPPQVIEALASEHVHVRQQALGALLQGIGVAVHRNIRREVAASQQQLLRDLPRQVQGHVGSTLVESEVKRDFFGKFPHFKDPALAPLVQSVTQQVAQEQNAQGWSEGLRDAIGARITQRLAELMGMPAGVVAPQPQVPLAPVAPVRQPFAPSGGAPPRPAVAPTNDPNSPANIGSVW